MTASCIATSMRWPRPVSWRWKSAARMPMAVCRPVPVSPMVGPGLSGRWPASPVVASAPPTAWAIMSKLRKLPYGPSGAKPLIWA